MTEHDSQATRLSSGERVQLLTDAFEERDRGLTGRDPLGFEGYRDAVVQARRKTGAKEAAIWGWAEVDGVRCALVVVDFGFLGGSMGTVVGEKVARAFDGARRERLPVLTVTASGGARMQEGMVALVQMAKTVEARRRHAGAGLGHVTLLTSPTTGGVYASFASLADLVFAEPEATVGFAGPRVVSELTGTTPPSDVHTAEFAYAHGLVDALVERGEQRAVLGRALRNLSAMRIPAKPSGGSPLPAISTVGAWERLQVARHPKRPKGPRIAEAMLTDDVPLHGDRQGGDDPSVVVRVGALRSTGARVVVVAQDASGDGRIRPAGYRQAMRGIELAGRLGVPLVTVIDTAGADPLPDSEGGGIASHIARTFLAMLSCPSPTLAVVTGEGGSGGALAMAAADRIVMWEHAVFSVIAPEGAASILYRDGSRAAELASRLRITAPDLLDLGIADAVVGEPTGGAQADPETAVDMLIAAIGTHLSELTAMPDPARSRSRRTRWRHTGDTRRS